MGTLPKVHRPHWPWVAAAALAACQGTQASEVGRVVERTPTNKTTADALSRDPHGLSPTRTASGAVKLDLRGRYQHGVLAKVDQQGQLQTSCVDQAEAVDAWTADAHQGHPNAATNQGSP